MAAEQPQSRVLQKIFWFLMTHVNSISEPIPLWHADMMPRKRFDSVTIELENERLRFHDDSADLILRTATLANGMRPLAELAVELSVSPMVLEGHLRYLETEGVILDLADYATDCDADTAIRKLRMAAQFYYRRVTASAFVQKLYSGQATREQFLGHAIEFYFYVRSAVEYMARGIAQYHHGTEIMAVFWDHFAEEARHSDIFRAGLIAAGIPESRLKPNAALPTTHALTNFLFERASLGLLEYGSLFAIMQPRREALAKEEISAKYSKLRLAYPFAEGIVAAFEQHDRIDAAAGHSSWGLETILRTQTKVTAHQLTTAYEIIRDASCFFIMFFDGIATSYQAAHQFIWRPLTNIEADTTWLQHYGDGNGAR